MVFQKLADMEKKMATLNSEVESLEGKVSANKEAETETMTGRKTLNLQNVFHISG